MISKANSSIMHTTYQGAKSDAKVTKPNTESSQELSVGKLEQLKESIGSGEYKVNIDALSEKMADSLL